MEFYIYSVYDPEIESFDARLNLAPFEPGLMAEQYRRTFVKLSPADKAAAKGKKVIWLGMFDDVSGTIKQHQMKVIFEFKEDKKEESQVKEGEEIENNA